MLPAILWALHREKVVDRPYITALTSPILRELQVEIRDAFDPRIRGRLVTPAFISKYLPAAKSS